MRLYLHNTHTTQYLAYNYVSTIHIILSIPIDRTNIENANFVMSDTELLKYVFVI